MSASLVGSEMCIRDRAHMPARRAAPLLPGMHLARRRWIQPFTPAVHCGCLLYTSDAADDM
eukprot:8154631-Alexandrium_andersonii.AAC.1